MLILIKFSAEIFQPRKEIQSIRVSLRGTIYGILAVCDWLLLGQTLGNAVPLSDYFLLSFGNYKLQQCSLGAPFAEPVCVGQQGNYQLSTSRRARPPLPPPSQPVHSRDKQANATTSATKSNCCSIKQKWDCHSLRWRRENCLIWFSLAVWVFESYFTVAVTKGNEVCFGDVTRCSSFHYDLDE